MIEEEFVLRMIFGVCYASSEGGGEDDWRMMKEYLMLTGLAKHVFREYVKMMFLHTAIVNATFCNQTIRLI